MKAIPLLDFDSKRAMIEPSEQIKELPEMPKKVVLTFFKKEVDRLYEDCKTTKVHTLRSEMGEHVVYKFMNEDVALFALGVGAPLAAGLFEELIALGGRQFLCCCGAGVLIKKDLGCLVLPNEGVRDEGTSFHYVEPSRTIKANKNTHEKVKNIMTEMRIDYIVGKTWTTDAFYRETKQKVNQRLYEGCLTVEMEFTALCAVAQYRNVEFAEILYCGDDLSREVWDGREWREQELMRKDLIFLTKNILERM
ncbi:Purine nucleoside phosphorylase DeoD-type [Candidatus Izimaplasma bacterium HR1]|jgi:uridine phosphorylase|uniref:nucleoside phosphorylase n=1 Tax=Candidatus Izimoplasma sp. HR1 TaxID=1541959 RepID=UPI0004F7E93F|nr:Purine nucleoside phosphorylase DeoD-type [Candidatus Izimaplasma bacterium HR1]